MNGVRIPPRVRMTGNIANYAYSVVCIIIANSFQRREIAWSRYKSYIVTMIGDIGVPLCKPGCVETSWNWIRVDRSGSTIFERWKFDDRRRARVRYLVKIGVPITSLHTEWPLFSLAFQYVYSRTSRLLRKLPKFLLHKNRFYLHA